MVVDLAEVAALQMAGSYHRAGSRERTQLMNGNDRRRGNGAGVKAIRAAIVVSLIWSENNVYLTRMLR
ncbi:hypothetical protein [Mesorhizobium sp. WSM3626]|uniref:hypothetical protein n=1 Tax=Mesorhizobium sp. WSM3626 TaxID=1040987 RepID=UPI0004828353|nr:hypothetical protein [Mesorhizobium sp. WSM3626]